MTKKRGADDEFDPFDDILDDEQYNPSSGRPSDDDDEDDGLDIMKMAEEDDDLLDEIEGRPRRDPNASGGIDLSGALGGVIQVIITAIIATVIFLALGAGIFIGARALSGDPVNLTFSEAALSLIPSTQPPAVVEAAAAPTSDIPVATAIPLPPTETPVPECHQQDADAWWAQQQRIYNTFAAVTPDSISKQANINGFLETLRLQREYSAAAPTDTCTIIAQNALVRWEDATMNKIRILTSTTGIDPNALHQAESDVQQGAADLTAGLWSVHVLNEDDSPVALGVGRGSASACGADAWLSQVEPIFAQFTATAAQIDVASQQGNTVRGLITDMQGAQTRAAAVTAPTCATTPSQLLQSAMTQYIAHFTDQLESRPNAAAIEQTEYERLANRYLAWVSWLKG